MPHRRIVAFVVLAAIGTSELRAADRYVAWLADGTRLTSKSLSAWPAPGATFRFESQELLTANNPVRLIRDRQATTSLAPPYLQMASGDCVGGTLVQLEPDQGRLGQVPRVRVQLEPPLMPVTGTTLSVRTDRIERIVVSAESTALAPPPGTVVLASGRRLMARSIRWREYGLAILTAEGIVEAPFGDLADVVFPGVDQTAAVIDDSLWATSASGTAIARFQATSGAVMTAARVSREQEQARRRGRVTNTVFYYLQPAWADQPLAIPEQEIVCCGYRAADEAPLTLFPARGIANRRLTATPEAWTLNRGAKGGVLAAASRESDIGLAAHAHSEIAFDLPPAARTLELAVGLDRAVGDGGCVRCKILAERSDKATTLTPALSQREREQRVLWDSGVFQGKDGVKATGPIDVSGRGRVVLVTELAHEGRPAGADPLDIRDAVVWLSPLVKLDLAASGAKSRAEAVLAGAVDWELVGEGWPNVQLASRWNVPASSWDPVLTLGKGAALTLRRKLRVTRASDVVELLTVCPTDLDEHEFSLQVNGSAVPWHNNADRNQLRQWTLRYSRTRARDGGEEESNLTDRLAYWWDLSPWRGEEVTVELTLRGSRERNEVAWRGLFVRSAIGNLPDDGKPLVPDVPLASLEPAHRAGGGKLINDKQPTRPETPVRLLGQEFSGGQLLPRGSSIAVGLKPEFRKFVGVVGCSLQVAGPVQVLIDDRVVWERTAISSLSPAEQIEIAIPAGSTTLTLQCGSDALYYGAPVFAEAGFVVGSR